MYSFYTLLLGISGIFVFFFGIYISCISFIRIGIKYKGMNENLLTKLSVDKIKIKSSCPA